VHVPGYNEDRQKNKWVDVPLVLLLETRAHPAILLRVVAFALAHLHHSYLQTATM